SHRVHHSFPTRRSSALHYLGNVAPGHLAPIDSPLLARLCMTLARIDEAEVAMGANMLVKAPNTNLPIQSPFLSIINRQTELAARSEEHTSELQSLRHLV